MAALKCTICGGTLEINEDMSVGLCEYCGSTIVIPKKLERIGNLYNRAIFLRQNKEFDKAIDIYEEILKEDNSDAEAHWGISLSRYGIEYVEDPSTKEYIPTCHRTQSELILLDPDYLAAIQYADFDSKQIYVREAEKISEIQKGILDISSKEDPFDIFLCYKESDKNGERTKDSVLAQELYYELIDQGYKVFFARISLESKIGKAYEPYIYSALKTSKIMVVIGTNPEYFNAVWVKNEWSRFLTMIKNGEKKVLIPAYRDMSPYELPDEFSHLQSQDMSKLGFVQDIIHGIKKLTDNRDEGLPINNNLESEGWNALSSMEALLRRANLYLEDGDFKDAEESFDKALDINPEDHRAYWGKVMAINSIAKEEDLEDYSVSILDHNDCKRAIRFAPDADREKYETIGKKIDNNAIYFNIVNLYNKAKIMEDYSIIALKLDKLLNFRDANGMKEEVIDKMCNMAKSSIDQSVLVNTLDNLSEYDGLQELKAECIKKNYYFIMVENINALKRLINECVLLIGKRNDGFLNITQKYQDLQEELVYYEKLLQEKKHAFFGEEKKKKEYAQYKIARNKDDIGELTEEYNYASNIVEANKAYENRIADINAEIDGFNINHISKTIAKAEFEKIQELHKRAMSEMKTIKDNLEDGKLIM